MSFKRRLHLYFRCGSCQHKSSLKDMKQWEMSEKTNLDKGRSSRSKVAAPRSVSFLYPVRHHLKEAERRERQISILQHLILNFSCLHMNLSTFFTQGCFSSIAKVLMRFLMGYWPPQYKLILTTLRPTLLYSPCLFVPIDFQISTRHLCTLALGATTGASRIVLSRFCFPKCNER